MKAFEMGMAGVAVLFFAAFTCFGIAQAGGNHSEQGSYLETRPGSTSEDSSSPDAETRPVLSFDDQDRNQLTGWPSAEMEQPMETGAIPATGSEEPWMREYGQD